MMHCFENGKRLLKNTFGHVALVGSDHRPVAHAVADDVGPLGRADQL